MDIIAKFHSKLHKCPETTAIIGREVSNCHPPENVHVVEQIVESFRAGEKNKPTFGLK